MEAGPLTARAEGGALRCVRWHGVEVLRAVECLIRDEDWGTLSPEGTTEERGPGSYLCRFEAGGATIEVAAEALADGLRVAARIEAGRDLVTNRAGLVVLHPAGLAGEALRVRHPDGAEEATAFPERVSPGQPALAIAGLAHRAGPLAVRLDFEGDVFEMEDQRNWTDASFKTYCRPLAQPRPYRIAAGEVITQTLTLTVSGGRPPPAAEPPPVDLGAGRTVRLPELLLAAEEGWVADGPPPEGITALLVRIGAEPGSAWLDGLAADGLPIDLEVVVPAGAEPGPVLLAAAERLGRAGLAPRRVVALPEPYMASHQPEGPWPDGPTPQDALDAAARAFPDAAVGAGMLTYFTELNRCRPPAGRGAHVTHSLAAIVHDADDASVLQTLEALPAVFATGREIAGDRPLRLGLCAIGLRTNPYGADVAPNPRGGRVPMAREDPRQAGPLAAAHAVGLAVRAAEAGVEAMALAGRGGPFGTSGPAGPHPIHAALEALARLGPGPLRAPEGLPDGVLGLAGPRGAILVNATLEPATLRLARAGRARPLGAAAPDGPSRTVQLAPCGVILLEVEP